MFEIIAVNGETYKFVGNYTMERFQRKISEEGWITCECGSILNTDHIVSFRKIKRMKSEPSFSNPIISEGIRTFLLEEKEIIYYQ